MLRKRVVVLTASCDESCAGSAAGQLTASRPHRRLSRAAVRALRFTGAPGRPATLRFRLSKATARKLARALHAHGRVALRITASATDAAGNRGSAQRVVKLSG